MKTYDCYGLRALAAEMVRQAVLDVRNSSVELRRLGWSYLRSRHCAETLAALDVDVEDAIGRLKARGLQEI